MVGRTVIIGAGIAGLSAAMNLERHGEDYVVLERNRELGYPIRSTGGIAKYFVDKYSIPSPPDTISAYIKSVDIRDDYGNHASIRFDHDVGLVYDYPRFIKNMAKGLNVRTDDYFPGARSPWITVIACFIMITS